MDPSNPQEQLPPIDTAHLPLGYHTVYINPLTSIFSEYGLLVHNSKFRSSENFSGSTKPISKIVE